MNLMLGLCASFALLMTEKKRQTFAVVFLIFATIVILSIQLAITSGIASAFDQRGFYNIIFCSSYFLVVRNLRINKRFGLILLLVPIVFPLALGLSGYYWKYMAGNCMILAAIAYAELPSRKRLFVLALFIAILAATIEKYSLIYLVLSVYASGLIRRRPLLLISMILVFFAIFYVAVENSEFGSLAEFIDRRVTRESYARAQGDTIFGISDGFRFEIWRQQIASATDSIWFGRGMDWQLFDSDVPNHNLLVTYLITFGIVGTVLIVILLCFLVTLVNNRTFTLCFSALIFLSLVGEGALLPFVAAAIGLQAGIFSALFESKIGKSQA